MHVEILCISNSWVSIHTNARRDRIHQGMEIRYVVVVRGWEGGGGGHPVLQVVHVLVAAGHGFIDGGVRHIQQRHRSRLHPAGPRQSGRLLPQHPGRSIIQPRIQASGLRLREEWILGTCCASPVHLTEGMIRVWHPALSHSR